MNSVINKDYSAGSIGSTQKIAKNLADPFFVNRAKEVTAILGENKRDVIDTLAISTLDSSSAIAKKVDKMDAKLDKIIEALHIDTLA